MRFRTDQNVMMSVAVQTSACKQPTNKQTIALTIDVEYTIEKCLDNNRKAQESLYNYTYHNLMAVVRRYVTNYEDAKWVFNMAMLKVFKALHKYKKQTNYLGFARTIITRSAIDHLRSQINLMQMMTPLDSTSNENIDGELNASLNKLATEEIMTVIQSLPDKERLVFSMYEIDGFSHKEIEKMTGIKMNTSKWLLSKAKKELRNILGNLYNYKHS